MSSAVKERSAVAPSHSGKAAAAPRELDGSSPGWGATLAIWVVLALACRTALWVTGFETKAVADAVERGAARVESTRQGEAADDVVRKAIQLQRASLGFWTTMAKLGDFVIEPLLLIGRALTAATLFAAIAAVTGRPIGFSAGLLATSRAQGYWVFGLAVGAVLRIVLRRPEVETSLVLLLPPGRYNAAVVLLARQVDPFAALGWLAIAWSGWRRRQANLATALAITAAVALVEMVFRLECGLVAGAGMRLSILPA